MSLAMYRKIAIALTVFAGTFSVATSSFADSAMDRHVGAGCREPFMIMRFSAGQTDPEMWGETLAALAHNRACADEVWFSTGVGYRAIAWHEQQSARCMKAAADVRQLGIKASLQIQMTVGHGDYLECDCSAKTWTGFTGRNGVACQKCSCPRDPAFLAYLERMAEIYAAWKPYSVWIDDDLRQTNHRPVSSWKTRKTDPYGCHCSRCLADYEKVKDGMGWKEFCDMSLGEVAARIASVFRRLSPETRMGLQGCGDCPNAILDALERASGGPVSYRSPGCYYYDWDDPRIKIGDAYSSWGFVSQMGGERVRSLDRICTEVETCPSTFSCRGATSLILQSMTGIAMGMSSMSYYILRPEGDVSWHDKVLFPALARVASDMKSYAVANEGTVLTGFAMKTIHDDWPWRLPFYAVPLTRGLSIDLGVIATGGTPDELRDGAVMELEIAEKLGVKAPEERHEMADGRRLIVLKQPLFMNSALTVKRFLEIQRHLEWVSRGRLPTVLETPARVTVFPRVSESGCLRTLLVQSAELDETLPLVFRLNGISPVASKCVWHRTGLDVGEVPLVREDGIVRITLPPVKPFGSLWLEIVK